MSRRDEQLFPDPAARVVWAGICALDEASQHDVLRELGQRLAFPNERDPMNTREVRVARAIAALREAAQEFGRSPSVNEYRHRRKTAHPDWPPDGSIRDWLSGGWNEVLKQAHLEAVPDDAPIVVEGAHAYTKDEIVAAPRECARELSRIPTFNNYLNWARNPEVKKRPGRRPRSQNVFERNFGGYPQALIAAGLADPDGTGVPMSTLQRSGRNYRWSDAELMAALTEAVDFHDGRFPTCGEYTRYRKLQLEESASKGAPRRIPAMNGFQRRFGGWVKTETSTGSGKPFRARRSRTLAPTSAPAAAEPAAAATRRRSGKASTTIRRRSRSSRTSTTSNVLTLTTMMKLMTMTMG